MDKVDPDEQRNAEIHRRIAAAIRRDPSLVAAALAGLEATIAREGEPPLPILLEWRAALTLLSPEDLVEFLESSSPRARRMRISSPFFGLA